MMRRQQAKRRGIIPITEGLNGPRKRDGAWLMSMTQEAKAQMVTSGHVRVAAATRRLRLCGPEVWQCIIRGIQGQARSGGHAKGLKATGTSKEWGRLTMTGDDADGMQGDERPRGPTKTTRSAGRVSQRRLAKGQTPGGRKGRMEGISGVMYITGTISLRIQAGFIEPRGGPATMGHDADRGPILGACGCAVGV